MMNVKKVSGVALATAAAALMLSGCGSNPAEKTMAKADTMAKSEMKVHCAGVNTCKGTSDCASATHECKGQNECKGHGWVSMTKSDCATKGGKIVG